MNTKALGRWGAGAVIALTLAACNEIGVPLRPAIYAHSLIVTDVVQVDTTIDGVAYFGAGTKTFDELWLGEALKRLTSELTGRFVGAAIEATPGEAEDELPQAARLSGTAKAIAATRAPRGSAARFRRAMRRGISG